MMKQISVIGKTTVDLPDEKALAIIRDIQLIDLYEPKIDSARIKPATASTGFYSVQGHFAGLPWGGKFSYELKEDGFYSELLEGPLGIQVSGGFMVKPQSSGQCSITHFERYQFPSWLMPFVFLIRPYLLRAMKEELRNLAKVIIRAFQPSSKFEERAVSATLT